MCDTYLNVIDSLLESCLYFFNYNVSVWLNTCKQRNAMVSMCVVTVVYRICFYSLNSSWFYCFILFYCKLIYHTSMAPILCLFSSLILFESYITSHNIRFWMTSRKWDNILQLVVIFLVIPPSILRQFTKFAEIKDYTDYGVFQFMNAGYLKKKSNMSASAVCWNASVFVSC